MRGPIRILGIDPGLRRTGWGVLDVAGNRLAFVACGSVEPNERGSMAERLVAIHEGLRRVIEEFRPEEAAVESPSTRPTWSRSRSSAPATATRRRCG
jgi:crossover junction endodeoxyribonuclease RuvC